MSKEAKEKKGKAIDELQADFDRSTIGVMTDYRGLLTADMTVLRRRLQAAQSEYKVVKNTLARFAAERSGKKEVAKYFEGPVGVTLGYGDAANTVKVLTGYIAETKSAMVIKGGFLGDRPLTMQEVMTLATLPNREVLLAHVVGQIASPIALLLGTLNAPVQSMVGVLQARINQLEGK